MGWFDDAYHGHEGYLVGYTLDARSGLIRELGYHPEDDDKRVERAVRYVGVGCDCGWRSPRFVAPIGTTYAPHCVCLDGPHATELEDAARDLWRQHLTEPCPPRLHVWRPDGVTFTPGARIGRAEAGVKDVGLLPDMSRPPVERAVIYIAGRLRHDGDLAYLCGPGTGSYEVLREACEALACRLELSREPSRLERSSRPTGPDCDDCGRELECLRCRSRDDDLVDAHEDCDQAILRTALESLIAAVDTSAAEVGSDLWCAAHEARMALQRTEP